MTDRDLAAWRGPRSFTAILPAPGDLSDVRQRLEQVRNQVERAAGQIEGLHTLRICAIPQQPRTGAGAAVLLNAIHDGPQPVLLDRLVEETDARLAKVLAVPPPELRSLLERHRVREQTVHLGAINATVAQIRADFALRRAINGWLDAEQTAGRIAACSPAEPLRLRMRAALQSHIAAPDRRPNRILRLLDLLASFAFPGMGVLRSELIKAVRRIPETGTRRLAWIALGLWWIYAAIPTGISLLTIRALELLERDELAPPPNEEAVRRLEAEEDRRPKNVVTLVLPVKPSWARRLLLRMILWGSERGCRHIWTRGALAGIETIHYARIFQLDRCDAMVFLSDYDGGLNRYFDDFRLS